MQRYNKLLIQTNILGEIYLKWYRFRPFLSLEPFYSVLILLIGFSEAARQLWTGSSEYPGAERDAIGEVREPVTHDVI